MEIIDPTRSDGPSYTLRIGRIDPSEKFTVIAPTPDSIRNALNIGGAGLADELRKAGLNDEECSAAKITQNMGQIYATAKMSAIARLWAYTQCAHRQAEQDGENSDGHRAGTDASHEKLFLSSGAETCSLGPTSHWRGGGAFNCK